MAIMPEALAGEEEEGGSGSPSISRGSGAAPRRLRSPGHVAFSQASDANDAVLPV
jgi:hypothetical protein